MLPRLQPATGTLVVLGAARSADSLPQTTVSLHTTGGWSSIGSVSGSVPAAPEQRQLLGLSVAAGLYDGLRIGGAEQPVDVVVTAGQVEPLLIGVESGHLIPGATYAGNDQVNLGLGELSGKFVAMPLFNLYDQAGNPFNNVTISGQDVVIAAFHTTCHQTCPLYTALFAQLKKQKLPQDVVLAEVTTDPATDTSSALATYARTIGASWTFATGTAGALTAFWKPFGVELATGDSHVSTLALLDRHGYIRLVYRGVPNVGHDISPALVTTLGAQGLKELASGGDGWGTPQVLQSLLTISGPEQPPSTGGGAAPAFSLTGTDGRRVSLSGLLGRPAVINFWAAYCAPCRVEMPMLQSTMAKQGLAQLVLVNEGDSAEVARSFLSSVGVQQPALLDSDLSVGHAYGAIALPITVFVRADGSVDARQIGQLDQRVLAAELSKLSAQ
ncbi:MAG TPA: redoxin family protein [Candidatus Dormibacteraeota bacterium]|nr:redoxin family protein [Candidatus Dormibacteraeota bacterium]